MLKLSGH